MMNKNSQSTRHWSIAGSGLLAVDIIVRASDEEVVDITSGGTCANVLSCLALFGWSSNALGRIGDDEAGRLLLAELTRSGVGIQGLTKSESVETPIIVERFGLEGKDEPRHRFEWKCPQCGSSVPRFRPTPMGMLEVDPKRTPDVFFFDRPTPGNIRIASSLSGTETVVMFEPPKLKDDRAYWDALEFSDIVKVSCDELEPLWRRALAKKKLCIVTKGQQGLEFRAADFLGNTHDWVTLPSLEVSKTVDACGSGDWLTAGFLHAFFSVCELASDNGGRLLAALKYGQALAALNCLLPGARGLMRAFDRVQIGEMVGVTLGRGLGGLETCVSERASEVGLHRQVELVCSSCRGVA